MLYSRQEEEIGKRRVSAKILSSIEFNIDISFTAELLLWSFSLRSNYAFLCQL